jgi:hypothetical protein
VTAALVLALAMLADARLVFIKTFPQSDPPYVGITIEQSGVGEFKSAPNDDQPVKFELTPEETTALFAAADKIDFSRGLESPVKVANMGMKTIRYEKDSKAASQTFNFTENLDARALAEWFENISESEQCFLILERTAKYEKVGVNDALLRLQTAWENRRLVAPQQFLPLLDRVAKGESYMRIARTRADALARTFRITPNSMP